MAAARGGQTASQLSGEETKNGEMTRETENMPGDKR
jgi:hypothetical protein